jgi:DNA-binding NtrC family response regulator
VHKILIVDDDKAMCDLLRACLSEGYEVIDTVDPEQFWGWLWNTSRMRFFWTS